jgi:plastocyanin
MATRNKAVVVLVAGILFAQFCPGQTATVSGQVAVHPAPENTRRSSKPDHSNIVIWLEPKEANREMRAPGHLQWRMVQKNKQFMPALLVVPVGSSVEFPNQDPFFHNVFSLFDGKRFDLALYQAGTSRGVKFDREGVSYIFCNIHPDMHAVVIALRTPLYAVSGPSGSFNITNVPFGEYVLHLWYERTRPDLLQALNRPVTVTSTRISVPLIRIPELQELSATHKNKFGKDYDRTPPTPLY